MKVSHERFYLSFASLWVLIFVAGLDRHLMYIKLCSPTAWLKLWLNSMWRLGVFDGIWIASVRVMTHLQLESSDDFCRCFVGFKCEMLFEIKDLSLETS